MMGYYKYTKMVPRHSVAISYKPEIDEAPKVLAQAHGGLVDKMIELAELYNIPIYQDQSLIEILKFVEVGSLIPVEAYSVVAEILSHIYNYERKHELK